VAAGTPEDVAKVPASYTGRYLARTLGLDKPAPARAGRRSA
jgi:excinuclease ABC subunit A